jgi:negative regulator of replication initiation
MRAQGRIETDCVGQQSLTAKVDKEMFDWVDTRADRAGVSRTEFLRRLLELYKASRERRVSCPSCGEAQDYSSVVEA